MSRSIYALSLVLFAVSACGRNPGAQPRSYPIPGIEKIEAQMARLRPKCMSADFSRFKSSTTSVGKEHFISENGGRFILDSYVLSQVIDRADHLVPSTVFRITDFRNTPRLRVEASCLDLKDQSLELTVSPVSVIDAKKGTVLKLQPFRIGASAKGELGAKSLETRVATSVLRLAKTPDAAILLGADYIPNFKTLKFAVDASDAKFLSVSGEFIGVDESFSRKLVRVEATYSWEPSL